MKSVHRHKNGKYLAGVYDSDSEHASFYLVDKLEDATLYDTNLTIKRILKDTISGNFEHYEFTTLKATVILKDELEVFKNTQSVLNHINQEKKD